MTEYGQQSQFRDTAGLDAVKARELAGRLELRARRGRPSAPSSWSRLEMRLSKQLWQMFFKLSDLKIDHYGLSDDSATLR